MSERAECVSYLKNQGNKFIYDIYLRIYVRVEYMKRYGMSKSRLMLKYLFNHSTAPASKKKVIRNRVLRYLKN